MDKGKVRKVMLALTSEELGHANEKYAEYFAASKPVDDETVVQDEQAQAWTQADLAQSFEQPVQAASHKLKAVRALDFGPKDLVEPGAIVELDGKYLVIGVSTDRFTCDGLEMMGLSQAAPIYSAIDGLAAGETGEFRGRTLKVDAIY